MCKINDNIQKSFQYIENILGEKIKITPINNNQLNMIPAFIANSYRLYNATLLNTEICLLYSLDSSLYSPLQIQKQKQLVENKLLLPVVFIFDDIVSYNIKRMIAQRINFIVPDSLKVDIADFCKSVYNNIPNADFFKSIGLPKITGEQLVSQLKMNFLIE